jgi:ATPase subunit of ABC transporter with duplicated ATPase domains
MFETEKEIANLYDKMAEEYTDELAEKIDKLQTTLNTNDFYSLEGKIMKVASGLGINAFGIDTKLANLSGGQRAKVILAKLLLESPDVLLMDEPTNFLDKNHVAWLTNYLSNYQGAFIIISHDHDFLNSITNCIIDIEFTKIKKYTGNFQQYLRLKEINTENYVKEYEKQQVTISKLQEYYDKNHARASTAKSAQSKLKQLEKLEIMPPAQTLPPPKFKFTATWIGDQEALRIENLEIGYDRVLLPKINLIMRSKEKIVINGFNGIGKSTFLKTILGIVPKISGEYT